MRKIVACFLVGTLFFACNEAETETETATETTESDELLSTDIINNPNTADTANVVSGEAPEITFEEEEYDFGTIKQGEKVRHTYAFTNTGEADLIISNARASCGCTVPSYPQEPIPPGEKGKIEVEFDSKGRTGKQRKAISIISNANPNRQVIYLTGEVETAENS